MHRAPLTSNGVTVKTLTKYFFFDVPTIIQHLTIAMVNPGLYSSYFPAVITVRRHHHRQPPGEVPGSWVVALRRTSFVASVVRFLAPYIELDTILLLPILLVFQLLCLMVMVDDT